ncbi:MAG: hypothetical protein ACI91T_000484 [Natronomonas sp.]|jgi:hypothetical protein
MTEAVDDLEAAAAELEAAESAVEERGEAELERIRQAYEEATGLLDSYENSATGSGGENFRAYVEFQEEITTFVEGLDDDFPHREAFEAALDAVDKRRLTEDDFAAARDALAPVREAAALLDRRDDAREAYREARRAVAKRRSELEDAIAERERLLELGEADLDAPVEALRDPIEAYNDAVRDAFETFRRTRPARDVIEFAVTAERFPLVDVPSPPDELRGYVHQKDAGDEPVPQLLEYAEYSRSKLNHYVDDPGELKRRVATHQTYLGRLDGSSLTLDWPPLGAEALRMRCDELISLVSRFAPEDVIVKLRRVRALTRDDDRYESLRNAAIAIEELGPDERERLRSGAVEAELESLREDHAAVEAGLDDNPSR